MKISIRLKFFLLLAWHTAVVFFLIGMFLYGFNLHEQLEHPLDKAEEAEEFLIIVGVMLLMYPLTLLLAWAVAQRLLKPWRRLVDKAEAISRGALDERIWVDNSHDEVGRLGTILNQAFDKYQMLLERMERYNYDASHQLRNPLAAIKTSSEVCLKHSRSENEYKETLEAVLDETNRLSLTVDQLLQLARCTAEDIQKRSRRFDLNEIVKSIAEEGVIVGEMRSIQVWFSAPDKSVWINGVPELFREALANLMDNALKYSPDNSVIKLNLSLDSDRIRIEMIDNGPGLNSEQKATIFRPFSRNINDAQGTGLGLALMADICSAHGADFGIDDVEPSGCCFWIELTKPSLN